MNNFFPLMQREWLQHRVGWAMMVAIPFGMALLLLGLGQIQLGDTDGRNLGDVFPAVVAMVTIVGSMAVMFLIAWSASLIIVSGLARRDLADRSVEFWLSLPISHSRSLAVPMFVHLILVPAAALGVGLLGGYGLSVLVVSRVFGFADWLALPWAVVLTATISLALRLLAGLALATLWLAPLILLVVLMTAWFRRWGWVILTVGMGFGGLLLQRVFGQPMLGDLSRELLLQARRAILYVATDETYIVKTPAQVLQALRDLPSWALSDFGLALRELPSPLLAGGLTMAALCFVLLVQWRQRGAGAAG